MTEATYFKDTITGLEPINSIEIPRSWIRDQEGPSFVDRSVSINYRPPEAPQAVLSLFYRGYEIDAEDSEPLRALLSAPGQKLSQNQFKSLGYQVLANMADQSSFQFRQAETSNLNGRNVLFVQGVWLNGSKNFYGLLVGRDPQCKEIKEVFFEACEPDYSRLIPAALKCIQSIDW